MTVYYLAGEDPASTISGGTRALGDHVAILNAHGIPAECAVGEEWQSIEWQPDDLVVVPETWGNMLRTVAPAGIRRVSFVQNGFAIDMGTFPGMPHPYVDCPELVAVLTECDLDTVLVNVRCPELDVPVIQLHSSGVGKAGGVRAGLRFGDWPRRRVVMYFRYKHDEALSEVLDGLELPVGWRLQCLTGSTDEYIETALRKGAIFVAPNAAEGMCAPPQEAMICGAYVVGWPGGPSRFADTPEWATRYVGVRRLMGGPMEYLRDRAAIVDQDDVEALRACIVRACHQIDHDPKWYAAHTAEYSAELQAEYSRARQVREVVEVIGGELLRAPLPERRAVAHHHRARPEVLRIGIAHESFGSSQHQQRSATPATGLRKLGHKVYASAFSFHGDVITLAKVDDARVLAMLEANKQIPAVLPPPDVMILRLMDQDESASIAEARTRGQLVFCDLDDDVWNIPEWNGASHYVKRDGEYVRPLAARDPDRLPRSVDLGVMERNFAAASGVLCSTPGVARSVEKHVPGARTFVCRNGIDPTTYYWPRKPVEHPALRVAWMGVTSAENHGGLLDVLPELGELLAEFGCEFWHLGAGKPPAEPPIAAFLPKGWTVPLREVPWAAAKHLPWLLSEIDVGIICRRPHVFTEAQSTVSGLAYAAAGVPFLASSSEEYEELAVAGCGITYDHPAAFFDVLRPLLADADMRGALRESGRSEVYWHHGPQQVAEQYVAAIDQAW